MNFDTSVCRPYASPFIRHSSRSYSPTKFGLIPTSAHRRLLHSICGRLNFGVLMEGRGEVKKTPYQLDSSRICPLFGSPSSSHPPRQNIVILALAWYLQLFSAVESWLWSCVIVCGIVGLCCFLFFSLKRSHFL